MVYLLLYVDKIILTACSSALLHKMISALKWEFTMKNLGSLHHFLGITVERRLGGLFLQQRTYLKDIVDHAGMASYKLCTSPVDLQYKLSRDCGPPVHDASQFSSLAGTLQYLTFTQPDVSFVVRQVCLHMHDPCEPHLAALMRILCYLQGTPELSLLLHRSSTFELIIYTDAD
jgi:hypothetical protein